MTTLAAALHAAPRVVLRHHVPSPVTAGRSRLLHGLVNPDHLDVAIGLPLRDPAGLRQFLRELYDPASPTYRQYLTTAQFTERFGPTEEDYRTVTRFARSHGMKILGTTPNRMLLDVRASVADLEQAFQFHIGVYQHPTEDRTFYAPDREPSIEAGIPILEIVGLDDYAPPRPMDLKVAPLDVISNATGSGPGGRFLGPDFRAAYAPGVTLNGAGQTIGLFELGPYFPGDVTAYEKAAGLPNVPVTNVLLDGVTGIAGPGTDDGEEALDIQMAISMAPGVSQVIVYEGNNIANVFNRMATDNLAKQMSCSFGFIPPPATMDQIFLEYAAQGQTMFVASGDNGAFSSLDRIFAPADNPNITSVGGTSLTTNGPGGTWQSETAWKGSGGGISVTYPLPEWQQKLDPTASSASTSQRNFPDVSMMADVSIYLIYKNGLAVTVGGTSAAAPLWAGYLALVNQQAAAKGLPPVGFLNPALYRLGQQAQYAAEFHDITVGNNQTTNSPKLFVATPGYDLTTGWGSPAGQALIDDLAGSGPAGAPGFNLSPSPYEVVVNQTGNSSTTVTVMPFNGFSGPVTLAVAGLPATVKTSFSPASTATTSTLTLDVGNLPAGTYTGSIIGGSNGVTQRVGFMLTVIAPDFRIAAAPQVLGITPGTTLQANISITDVGTFRGPVNLTASGVPPGVTAEFFSATTSAASILALTATGSAVPGVYPITITGAAGTLSHAVTINLLVSPAGNPPVPVDLSSFYNRFGITTDATPSTGGLDNNFSYPASQLGTSVTVNGVPFVFGPPNVWNDVSASALTVPLPPGRFDSLQMVGTAVGGATLTAQRFQVRYSDGTTDTFTQSLSDWFAPQSLTGETTAATVSYRNTRTGAKDNRTFYLYNYSFKLAANKVVTSVLLPASASVEVLAMTLVPPAAVSSNAPRITSVVNGATFQPVIGAGGWMTVYGSNLSTTARTWTSDELAKGTLPIQLDGVSVTIGGSPAAVYFVSPTQLNVQAPTDTLQGSPVFLQVTTDAGTVSTAISVAAAAPGLFSGDGKRPAAQHASDFSLVGPTPARPGETILLYGTGFGPTAPAVAGRQIVTQAAPVQTLPVVRIGNQQAEVTFAGLISAGLYQINVIVPAGLPDGDAPIVATLGESSSQPGLSIPVKN